MKLGISPKANLIDLNSAKRRGLTNLVDQFCTDKMLKRELMLVLTGITRHGCYKGIRLKQGLPANGQRTRSNAMTARRRLAFSSISNLGKA
jgi:small subunit ribosomal protein S13